MTHSVGDKVMWLHEPRGGYGFLIPVRAYVVKLGRRRVGIAALHKSGEWLPRWVSADRLRPRSTPDGPGL